MTDYENYKPDVWDRLWFILLEGNENDIIYVYLLGSDGHPVRPYLDKCESSKDFLTWLQGTHGPGEYRLLIRRDREMIFSGNIGIG